MEILYTMLICQYCSKECKNSNSHKNHESRCPKNADRTYVNGKLGKKGRNHWMKAKDDGIPYLISDETRAKFRKSSAGRVHTEETKRKLSEIRKKFIEENPDKVPYLLNHSSNISYPEQYFMECFKDIKENIEFQYKIFRYSLDFANPKEKLYLEIDGDQHYLDKRIVEHDIRRTQKLKDAGWSGVRLRWSEFKKLNEDQKKEKILEIRFVMKWLS